MSADQYFLNGKYKLATIAHEMRMSHWLYAPVLTNLETQEVLLDLQDSIWDLRSAKESEDSILLTLARYHEGNSEYLVELNPIEGTAIVCGVSHPMFSVLEAINAIV